MDEKKTKRRRYTKTKKIASNFSLESFNEAFLYFFRGAFVSTLGLLLLSEDITIIEEPRKCKQKKIHETTLER